MEENTISLVLSILALLVALFSLFSALKKKDTPDTNYNTVPLQLQAYERLVLFCERISIPNLVSRINQPDLNARSMQLLLLENIKQEFEYNATQQVYVSKAAWDSVRNLREQNMLIINQVANILPPEASAHDLNRQLLELIMNQKDAALHTIVLGALNAEAKKLLK